MTDENKTNDLNSFVPKEIGLKSYAKCYGGPCDGLLEDISHLKHWNFYGDKQPCKYLYLPAHDLGNRKRYIYSNNMIYYHNLGWTWKYNYDPV
jgi:hypothetical protein